MKASKAIYYLCLFYLTILSLYYMIDFLYVAFKGEKGFVFEPMSKTRAIFYFIYYLSCFGALIGTFFKRKSGWLACNILIPPFCLILIIFEIQQFLKTPYYLSILNVSVILSSFVVLIINNRVIFKTDYFFSKKNFFYFLLGLGTLILSFIIIHKIYQ